LATYDVIQRERKVQLQGNGTAGPFQFLFQIESSSHLKVYVDDVEKQESSHYTVTINADGSGGSISFTSSNFPTSSEVVTLISDIPLSRTSIYTSGGDLTAQSLESDFDTSMFIHQQTNEEVNRSIRLPEYDVVSSDTMILPAKADRLGKTLGFHSTTGAIELKGDYIISISSDSGSGTVDTHNSETLTITGGEGIDTSLSGQTFTISGEDASTTNKGIANYSSTYFSVNTGTVSLRPDQYAISSIGANSTRYLDMSTLNEFKFTFDSTHSLSLYKDEFTLGNIIYRGMGISVNETNEDFFVRVNDGGTNRYPFIIDGGTSEIRITSTDLELNDTNLILRNNTTPYGDGITLQPDPSLNSSHTITLPNATGTILVDDGSGNVSISGNLTANNNLTVTGDLTVNGTTTTVNTATLSVEDPLISLANGNNSTDSVDIGFYGLYDTTGSQDLYAGFFRDASDDKFKLFKSLQTEPTSTVNTSGTGYTTATLVSNLEGNVTGDLTGNVTGDVTGNLTGNLTGNVTGNVTGDVTGDLTGNVTGNVTGNITGDVTGAVTGNVTGDVTGNLTGNVTGDVTGSVTGSVTGDVTGNLTGNVTGNVTGDVTGDLTGNVIGDVTGITSLINSNLVVGIDTNNTISFVLNDRIDFKTSGFIRCHIDDFGFKPSNTTFDIGSAVDDFENGFFSGTVYSGTFETSDGIIAVKNDGTQSEVRLYCESNNAHYASLQAPAHADFTGNVTLTLPANTGTLISTANSDTPTTTTTSSDADHILIDDGGVMKKITPANLGIGSGSGITVQDEGSSLTTSATTLNFVGAGVVASGTGSTKTITIAGGSDGVTVQDEGTSLATTGTTLNFVGAGVTASGTGATKTITISGGSGGGGGTTAETYGASLEGKLGLYNDVGDGNTIIGSGAYGSLSEPLPNISTANALTILGANAGTAITSGFGNTIIGANSADSINTGTNNTILGKSVATFLTTGYDNVMIGNTTGLGAVSDFENVYIGTEAGESSVTGSSNYRNVAIGHQALSNSSSSSKNAHVAIGYLAGDSLTTGDNCVLIGHGADNLSQNGDSVAIGLYAQGNYRSVNIGLNANRTGSTTSYYNTQIGYAAGYDMDGGDYCVFIGYQAGYAGGSQSNNVGVGAYALDALVNGEDNVGIGHASLGNCTAGDGNSALGYYSGVRVTTGSYNTNIGYNTTGGSSNYTGSYNTTLGQGAAPSSTTSSYQFTLGNSSVSTLRCNVTSITSLSDQRDKTAIEDLDLGLDFINAMRPVSFVWNRRDGTWHGRKEVGFIAQELHEVEMDFNSTDKTRLVNYDNPSKLEAAPMKTYPILIKAIQELSAKVDSLQARITELEGE